ncbi:MAG: beta-propeller domain-containing protein [Pseudomonadota bacterium]
MNKKILFLISFPLIFSAAGSCSNKQDNGVSIEALASLHGIDDCDGVLRALKDRVIEDMEQRVDENLLSVLEGDFCNYYGGGVWLNGEEADYDASTGTVPSPSEGREEASEYSETNTQVDGVDEADFVKNDGGHIYILADGSFKIIDAWPAPEAHIISSVPIEGEPTKLFVLNDRALVYSALGSEDYPDYYYGYGRGECTYGYDCDFTGDGRPMKMTVLDISDMTDPEVVRETVFSGSYINSRRIGSAVFTVVTFPEIRFPEVSYMPDNIYSIDYCFRLANNNAVREAIVQMFNQLKKENRRIIEDTEISDWIPTVKDTIYADGEPETQEDVLGSCGNFYKSGLTDGRSLLTISSVNMEELDPMTAVTIVGRPGAVYASNKALYVSSRHYNTGHRGWYYPGPDAVQEVSTVHKFSLVSEKPAAEYAASGVVKGKVLNQFAMDEHDGFLRMATTTGHVPDPNVHSTISILEQDGSALKVVGQIDDIAPTEDIRSARFSGNRGFIVTFKKTDPLFVFDLGDPRNPATAGELKIPGFSTYMHMLDDNHILSIGYDADDQGSFAWFTGIMLQVFDISKMDNPTLIHKEVIGTRGSTSDATTNHLAFNFFRPKNLLAIPMTICEDSSGGGSYGTTMTFSGLLVYEVTVDDGFASLGGVAHADPGEESGYNCGNWWTNSNSLVKRSIFMEDYVYSIALDLIKINRVDALGDDLVDIPLVD